VGGARPEQFLEELAKGKVYEFAFIMQPLKIRGGSESTVAPTAIK